MLPPPNATRRLSTPTGVIDWALAGRGGLTEKLAGWWEQGAALRVSSLIPHPLRIFNGDPRPGARPSAAIFPAPL